MTKGPEEDGTDWRRFVLDHGFQANADDLAFILKQPKDAIQSLRATGGCTRRSVGRKFHDLFHLWHGRYPEDQDWPSPRIVHSGRYEWQAPELALLASLVGRLSPAEISELLTRRLRQMTGDQEASRSLNSVHLALNRLGLQTSDLVGGITPVAAGLEIDSASTVYEAIHKGHLRALKVGKRVLIPRGAWSEWKAGRTFPPDGFVRLATIRETMSIRSDKLSEYARLGYIPTAVRCNPYGAGKKSTQFGSWYVDGNVAKTLVADRHAGRRMPWHGKPLLENLKVTYRLWQRRKHPPECATCTAIWGKRGAPADFESYAKRYPDLDASAKRHLTGRWAPGLTIAHVARKSGRSENAVRKAVDSGTLAATKRNGKIYASQADATQWIAKGRQASAEAWSWVSLATVEKRYLFTQAELEAFVKNGRLVSKVGTNGAMRGIVYVTKQSCTDLREQIGLTQAEAAHRAGIDVTRIRKELKGMGRIGTQTVPLAAVQSAIRPPRQPRGYTVEDAAEALGRDTGWVRAKIADGTVCVVKSHVQTSPPTLSVASFQRLRAATKGPELKKKLGDDWLRLGSAAKEAGVSIATINNWGLSGELTRTLDVTGWRYHRDAVRGRARAFWRNVRLRRAKPPQWLLEEIRKLGEPHCASPAP